MYRLPGGTVDKNPPANTGDTGLILDLRRFHTPWCHEALKPQLLRLCPGRALEP